MPGKKTRTSRKKTSHQNAREKDEEFDGPDVNFDGKDDNFCPEDESNLCSHFFPLEIVSRVHLHSTVFSRHAIVANDTVAEFNDIVLQQISGEIQTHIAIHTAEFSNSEESVDELSADYLQNLCPASLPPSLFKLKIGAPILLL
ncbi:hypothetical protein DFP73DRAFT_600774 [Morchella snyderi]|nr:hypothetical protein DFP73DRAFT_600774 [Morchella snyderi]